MFLEAQHHEEKDLLSIVGTPEGKPLQETGLWLETGLGGQ